MLLLHAVRSDLPRRGVLNMISAERLNKQLQTIKKFSAPGRGINRLAFTDSDWQCRRYLITQMKEAGLSVRTDAFGNVIGRLAGQRDDLPAVMTGSHGDSVPEGGNYDGIVGVLSAIEAIRSMQEDGFRPIHPIEVVLFMCEESSRFSAATLGSRAMRGRLPAADLLRLHDAAGKTLHQVLKDRGLDPEHIASARYEKPLKAFLEVHIEQGRVLEHDRCQIGIVTGIAAPYRLRCRLHGRADHSGATPMNLRQDGLCAAAKIILAVERIAAQYTPPVVGTVGVINVSPGVMNVIPGEVQLGIDVRSTAKDARDQAVENICAEIRRISSQRGIPVNIERISREDPAVMDPGLVRLLTRTAKQLGFSHRCLPSGAGHDSMHWADYTPTGMIFLPCRDGISHNPAEYADIRDITAACTVLSRALRELASGDTQPPC